MECPGCGFNNPAEFEFCGKCGASLSGDLPEAGAARSRLPPMMAGADAADAAADTREETSDRCPCEGMRPMSLAPSFSGHFLQFPLIEAAGPGQALFIVCLMAGTSRSNWVGAHQGSTPSGMNSMLG